MLTSGQLAKQCHTSIRTVQYYDQKGLLHAKRSQSNRREYDKKDLLRLQQIITYRQLGFQLKDIQMLMENNQTSQPLAALIDKQTASLHQQIHQLEAQLEGLKYLKKQLYSTPHLSRQLQEKIRSNMKMTKQLRHLRLKMIGWGLVIDLLFWGSLIFVINHGSSPWWLVLGFILTLLICGELTSSYYQHSIYLCPHCRCEFVPRFKNWVFAPHTPNTRKLTCPTCHQRNFCVEEYR
ncbi:MerR family transcriptional regulator [uncultured Limosilactobacillus sp.]|uniref:MerR family transcriptional regulator n=1 Tax=uncultured Limosilactobacillus sp. TaxID=2837629 RepID=UPI0025F7D674|nr:MerR family transcriptional regulator [uncultured Limosilactobacillus sp.]